MEHELTPAQLLALITLYAGLSLNSMVRAISPDMRVLSGVPSMADLFSLAERGLTDLVHDRWEIADAGRLFVISMKRED